MRIAVINRVFAKSGGGAESYCVNLVEQLAKKHEVHVFAQQFGPALPGVTYQRIFCLHPKPRWINQLLFATASWWRTRRGFDIVHSHENTWHGQVQTIHVRPLRHNLLPPDMSWLARLLRWLKISSSPRLLSYVWLERARFKAQADRHIVATSESLKLECAQTYPNSAALLSVITPGVCSVASNPALTPDAARCQLGLPLGLPLLLFVANDYARKGLHALLQALAQLPPNVQLAVAGQTHDIGTYRNLAQQLGLAQRVHFLGSLDDLTPAYRSADCLAHPTLEDSFAMVVLEAMASGLPVVVSSAAYCGIARHLQDGQQALLLPNPRDASALASLLNKVLTQPALAQQLSQRALEFARHHTWDNAAQQYEVLYRQAKDALQKSKR